MYAYVPPFFFASPNIPATPVKLLIAGSLIQVTSTSPSFMVANGLIIMPPPVNFPLQHMSKVVDRCESG